MSLAQPGRNEPPMRSTPGPPPSNSRSVRPRHTAMVKLLAISSFHDVGTTAPCSAASSKMRHGDSVISWRDAVEPSRLIPSCVVVSQPHAGAAAVGIDELDARFLKGAADR
jgi:hypothetical protein